MSRGESTRAIAVAHAAGVAVNLHEYEPPAAAGGQERRPAWGADAAAALGVDPRRMFKTLVAAVDGRLVVGIVPVAGELDLRALAAAAGGRRAVLATAAEAERATGYVLGGISPLGMRRPLPAIVDATVEEWPTVHVSAGRRGLQLEIVPADLVRLTGATVAAIARAG